MTTNLYQVAHEYRLALESEDDEAIESAGTDLTVKARNVVAWALNREAQCVAIKHERDRLDALLKAEQGRADWARAWLLKGMQQAGISELNLDTMIIKVKTNPPSVQVQDGAIESGLLEDRFIRTKTIREADKAAIKKAMLEDGEVIAGCTITRAQRVEIK